MRNIFSIACKSPAVASAAYRPDIDGLRAVAVLAVCFYHAKLAGFDGGYVGVDVFFVVSGFLIASLISSEIEAKTFSLISFYERRMRRIFPALFNVALWIFLAALVLLNPDDMLEFGKSLMAMAAFVSNLFFAEQASLGGYFGNLSGQQPLLHTWSLSVEEQFYIFFPVTMMALSRWAGRWRTWVLLVVSIVSLIFGYWSAVNNAAPAFFFIVPRVWEFICGSLLATASLLALKSRFARELAGIIGLALVAYAITTFDKSTVFPGLNALFPCIGAALLIHAGTGGTSSIKTLLSFPPLVFVGVISYSLYLWHWPILVFAQLFLVRGLDNFETAIALAFALLAAFLSFEFVEIPFRGKHSRIGRKQVFGFGAIAAIICIFMGAALVATNGLPQRYDAKTREIVLKNLAVKKDGFLECGNWRSETHEMSDIRFCEFGRTESGNVLIWGDSSVGMLGRTIKEAKSTGSLPGQGVILAINSGCTIAPNVNIASESGFHCDDFNKFALQRAEADDVGAVMLVFGPWWAIIDGMCLTSNGECLRRLSISEMNRYFFESVSAMIQELRARGKRVIVSLPFPFFDRSVPDAEIHNALFSEAFGQVNPVQPPYWADVRGQLISMAKDIGADIFDPRASLCNGESCKYETDGVSIYQDDYHIAASQTGILKADLIRTLSGQ